MGYLVYGDLETCPQLSAAALEEPGPAAGDRRPVMEWRCRHREAPTGDSYRPGCSSHRGNGCTAGRDAEPPERPTPRSIAEFCCCCCCFSSFLPCSKNTLGIAVSASLCICVHTRVVLGAELSVHTPKFQMIFSTCASTHSVLEPGLGRSGVLSHGRVPKEAGGSRLNL